MLLKLLSFAAVLTGGKSGSYNYIFKLYVWQSYFYFSSFHPPKMSQSQKVMIQFFILKNRDFFE